MHWSSDRRVSITLIIMMGWASYSSWLPQGALASCISLHITHHHVMSSEARRPMAELAADEEAELHRSELQHLKVKLETWNKRSHMINIPFYTNWWTSENCVCTNIIWINHPIFLFFDKLISKHLCHRVCMISCQSPWCCHQYITHPFIHPGIHTSALLPFMDLSSSIFHPIHPLSSIIFPSSMHLFINDPVIIHPSSIHPSIINHSSVHPSIQL